MSRLRMRKFNLFRHLVGETISTHVTVPQSRISLRVGKSKSELTTLHSNNLHCMLASSFDTRPVVAAGPNFMLPEYAIAVDPPTKPGIFVLTVDVFVQGVKPSDGARDVVKADPKWAFHFSFLEWERFSRDGLSEWVATSMSNDGTEVMLELNWKFSTQLVSLSDAFTRSVKKYGQRVCDLHETVRRHTSMRSKQIAECVVNICKDESLKKVIEANVFRVPCSIAGPILQDHAGPCKQGEAQLLVDFEQAVAFNSACVALRPEFWATLVMHLLLVGLTKAYQKQHFTQLPPDQEHSCRILTDFFHTSVDAQALKDLVFSSASEFTASHSRYTPDTQVLGELDSNGDLVIDGNGESQLMSGINYVCTTLIRRKVMSESKLCSRLPSQLQDPYVYTGEIEPFDCEDGSYQVTGVMAFIDMIPGIDVERHFSAVALGQCRHVGIFVPLLVQVCTALRECRTRNYLPTLGIARASSFHQVQPTSGVPVKALNSRKSMFEAFQTSMRDGTACGHSWAVGFESHPLSRHGNAIFGSFTSPMHCEQTSDTEEPEKKDMQVCINFDSSSSKIKDQLSHYQNTSMPLSMACSIKNDLFAQCLNDSFGQRNGIKFAGVQYANNREDAAFLQYIICAGGHHIFATDNALNSSDQYMTPTSSIPFYDEHTTATVQVPLTGDEQNAISTLAAVSIAQFPKRPGIYVLPPFCLQTFGSTSDVRILASHGAESFDKADPYSLVRKRKMEMAELQQGGASCCGFRIIEICRTIFFFQS